MNVEKTELMSVGQERKETNIRLEEAIIHGNRFEYLRIVATGIGKSKQRCGRGFRWVLCVE